MTCRLSVHHLSRYRYREPVIASYNEARMTPITSWHQIALSTELRVSPGTPIFRYIDYWSSVVHAFDIHEPHRELCIAAESTVETSEPELPPADATWASLLEPVVTDRFAELLAATASTPRAAELDGVADELRATGSPFEALEAVAQWVHDALRYEPGTTAVSTSALDAWRQGAGVCQDFAHLSIVLLRRLRIPARYVSGYVHPASEVELGVAVTGTSHAWVEAWLGRWYAIDPTSGSRVGEHHVTVARGRDYRDVAPLLGVYHGGELDALEVEVTLTRVA